MLDIRSALPTLLALAAFAPGAAAQLSEAAAFAAQAQNQYRIVPNITYLTANNYEDKLDVYVPKEVSRPNPTLIYIHGGGWTGGSKESSALTFLSYLEKG